MFILVVARQVIRPLPSSLYLSLPLAHTHLHKPTSMTDRHMHSSKTCLESRAKLSFLYLLRPDGTEEEEASLPAPQCSALRMASAPRSSPAAESRCSDLFMKPSFYFSLLLLLLRLLHLFRRCSLLRHSLYSMAADTLTAPLPYKMGFSC